MLPDIKDILKPRPRKFRNIARHLSPLITAQDSSVLEMTETDIFDDLSTSRGTDRFLGLFSKLGVQYSLKNFGIYNALESAGLPKPQIHLDTSDPYKHQLRIAHSTDDGVIVSGEIAARRGQFAFPGLPGLPPKKPKMDLIFVEWLMLQHPEKPFSRFRPQLPGQDHPGLGIANLVYEAMYWSARRDNADGIMLVPNYLHTGLFYGRQFLFPDPRLEGLIYYFEKYLLLRYQLDQLTWACTEGQLINNNEKKVFNWQPSPMILPVSLDMKDYFNSPQYTRAVREFRNSYKLRVNSGYKKRYTRDWKAKSNG